MYSGLAFLGQAAMLGVVAAVWRARRYVAATTLRSAWRWMMTGCLAWSVAYAVTSFLRPDDRVLADRTWYGVAAVMLCAPVSVLGARRPINRVWTWFVIVPLLLVLGLPLVQGWQSGRIDAGLELELPATLGYVLVLVMGAGNYFGTRFTLASFLFAGSLLLLVLPISAALPQHAVDSDQARIWASFALAGAALAAFRKSKKHCSVPGLFNRLWLDFRDFFGLVWAKRVQNRINETAAEERWPVRLEMQGLAPSPADQATAARVERAYRWILRRFVDSKWIDDRIPTGPATKK